MDDYIVGTDYNLPRGPWSTLVCLFYLSGQNSLTLVMNGTASGTYSNGVYTQTNLAQKSAIFYIH